ncbi:MAG: hypothetical protein ABL879_05935 [Devosia sp.]
MPKLIPLLLAANVLVMGGLAITTAQSQTEVPVEDVLRAKLIELVNDKGDVVAELHAGEDGSGQLRLRNGNGDVRVKLGPSDSGAGASLTLMDARTDPAVLLASGAEGARLLIDGVQIGGN